MLVKWPALDRISRVLQVNLSGVIPGPFMTSYSASQFAVCGFTGALRDELRLTGSPLTIALVLPGFVGTPFIENDPKFVLPKWFSKFVVDPETVVREIVRGIEKDQFDLTPSWKGKALHFFNRLAPKLSMRSSRWLVATDWKEDLGLKPVSR